MKCPKCGYNSFEYHDSCKKCAADFSGYKQTYGITSIVMPAEVKEQRAAEFRSASSAEEQPAESVETHDDMFSFDLPEDSASPVSFASQDDDPFNFDDDLPETGHKQAKIEDEGFADLLESTSQADDNPFASSAAPSPPPAPSAPAPASASGPGEFDLENFSWDDTPAATATGAGQDTNDDFDSLFGDTGDSSKK